MIPGTDGGSRSLTIADGWSPTVDPDCRRVILAIGGGSDRGWSGHRVAWAMGARWWRPRGRMADYRRMLRSRPCRVCRRWFHPHSRIGDRQRVCSATPCQEKRQQDNAAAWRARHPAYGVKRRMRLRELRAAKEEAVDPLELPGPLGELPWEVAQEEFGVQGADFIGHLARLVVRRLQELIRKQSLESTRESSGLRGAGGKEQIRAQAASGHEQAALRGMGPGG